MFGSFKALPNSPCACVFAALQAYQIPETLHTASINSVCFAPEELGLMLACGSSDMTISIIRHHEGQWETTKVLVCALP